MYGTSFSNAADWQYSTATKNANYIDFASAKTQATNFSSELATWGKMTSSNVINVPAGQTSLVGTNDTDLQIFNIGNTQPASISLSNIKAGAFVIINSTLTNVTFSGNNGDSQGTLPNDPLFALRDRIIWNFPKATSMFVASVNGTILAPDANVTGSGHLEGNIIANSLSAGSNGKLEIGYEPFKI